MPVESFELEAARWGGLPDYGAQYVGITFVFPNETYNFSHHRTPYVANILRDSQIRLDNALRLHSS